MLRFYADKFVQVFDGFVMSSFNLPLYPAIFPPEHVNWEDLEFMIRASLTHLARQCEQLPVSPPTLQQIRRAAKEISFRRSDTTNSMSMARLFEIRQNVLEELRSHSFYYVPSKWAHLLEKGEEPAFGEKVGTAFQDAKDDIAASGRCLAMGEWTACVFHCMRVLESGLHVFAKRVRIRVSTPLELQNWANIINDIESKIDAEEKKKKPKAPAAKTRRNEKLRQWAEAAHHFRHLKNAWRNHVAHGRVSYKEEKAEAIWNHTRDFMQAMAEIV